MSDDKANDLRKALEADGIALQKMREHLNDVLRAATAEGKDPVIHSAARARVLVDDTLKAVRDAYAAIGIRPA